MFLQVRPLVDGRLRLPGKVWAGNDRGYSPSQLLVRAVAVALASRASGQMGAVPAPSSIPPAQGLSEQASGLWLRVAGFCYGSHRGVTGGCPRSLADIREAPERSLWASPAGLRLGCLQWGRSAGPPLAGGLRPCS